MSATNAIHLDDGPTKRLLFELLLATLATTSVATGVSLNTYASQVGVQITYRAVIASGAGAPIVVVAETIEGRRPMQRTEDIGPITADAFEVMIERIHQAWTQHDRPPSSGASAAPSP